MNKYLISTIIILVVIRVGVFSLYKPTSSLTKNTTSNASSTQQSQSSAPKYGYTEQYKTASRVFLCQVRSGTESGCELFVSDSLGNDLKDLGLGVDYGDFNKKISPSPDGKNLLIILESRAIILNTATLTQKVLFQSPAGDTLGTYDAFPAFIPYVRWVSNTQIQISIFKQYTPEPYQNEPAAVPIETRTISIN